jgi:hypothetical protein
MNCVLSVFAVAGLCAFWLVGMANYLTIARVAGLRFPGGLQPVAVYRHAFTTMKGSRETRAMLVGFAGAMVWAMAVASVMAVCRMG